MPYVERRDGKVVGVYANAQPGYAEEFIHDVHPDIIEFMVPQIAREVDRERDRRLMTVPFGGKLFDYVDGKGADRNIAAKATIALAAMFSGSSPGDLRWDNPNSDFAWIAADNSRVAMDAKTFVDLAEACEQWRSRHMLAARRIKDMRPIPSDFTANQYWE